MSGGRKIAVVLLNLGGPDGPDDVRPFLFNLFNDPAIIAAPTPIRWALAMLISATRASAARNNYAKMGGGSPLLAETERQAAALKTALDVSGADDVFRVFVGMSYWSPFVADAARAVKDWGADEVVLLPLYPQFSTSTTGSSLAAWRAAKGPKARVPCCYPTQDLFVAAHARRVRETWEAAGRPANARVLFSAHGLPQRTIDRGDPYQWQIERTVESVGRLLPELPDREICYQSRVGPLKWIGPSTQDAIARAAQDGKSVILTPIAFVSEHIETLVELDEEYAELAAELGVSGFHRAPALGLAAEFIDGLAETVLAALDGGSGLKPPRGARLCPASFGGCPCAGEERRR